MVVEGAFSFQAFCKGEAKRADCCDTLKSMVKTMCLVWPPGHCRGTLRAQPQQSWARVWDVALGQGGEHLK